MRLLSENSTLSFLMVAIALALAASTNCAPFAPLLPADLEGARYFCGKPLQGRICVTFLVDACGLQFVEGKSLPSQAEDRVVLRSSEGHQRDVRHPDDMKGCVRLADEEQALEYLRFFSSPLTVYLFDYARIEVGRGSPGYLYGPEGDCGICLPPRRWQELGLSEPRIHMDSNGFLITRYIVKRASDNAMASNLYRIREKVHRDGIVDIVEEMEIPLTPAERYGLGFPSYL